VLDDVERLKKGGIEESTRDEHGEFFSPQHSRKRKIKRDESRDHDACPNYDYRQKA
jgi:hypothetical protein